MSIYYINIYNIQQKHFYKWNNCNYYVITYYKWIKSWLNYVLLSTDWNSTNKPNPTDFPDLINLILSLLAKLSVVWVIDKLINWGEVDIFSSFSVWVCSCCIYNNNAN